MEKFASIIFPILGLLSLFQLIRFLFVKGILHFKMIKMLFPEKLQGVNSYLELMWIPNFFKLDISTMLWIVLPFYYPKVAKKKLPNSCLEYHDRLLKTNRKIVISFLLYIGILSLFAASIFYFDGI